MQYAHAGLQSIFHLHRAFGLKSKGGGGDFFGGISTYSVSLNTE